MQNLASRYTSTVVSNACFFGAKVLSGHFSMFHWVTSDSVLDVAIFTHVGWIPSPACSGLIDWLKHTGAAQAREWRREAKAAKGQDRWSWKDEDLPKTGRRDQNHPKASNSQEGLAI